MIFKKAGTEAEVGGFADKPKRPSYLTGQFGGSFAAMPEATDQLPGFGRVP